MIEKLFLELKLRGWRSLTLCDLWLLKLGDLRESESEQQEFGMRAKMLWNLLKFIMAKLGISVNESMQSKMVVVIQVFSELHNVVFSVIH